MSDKRDIVQHLKDDAAGMCKAATEQPDYYAVLGVYAMTCHEAADEIERLRVLIAAWADAEVTDGFHDEPECGCGAPLCVASAALRKVVGR